MRLLGWGMKPGFWGVRRAKALKEMLEEEGVGSVSARTLGAFTAQGHVGGGKEGWRKVVSQRPGQGFQNPVDERSLRVAKGHQETRR